MPKHIGAKISMALTAFALVVCVTAFFMLNNSLAWFAKNENVSGRGIALAVKEQDVIAQLLVLGVLEIDNSAYTFDTAVDQTTGARIQETNLPVDDPNGISYSKYSKALVLELTLQVSQPRYTEIRFVANSQEYHLSENNDFSTCIQVSNATLTGEATVTKTTGSTQPFVNMQTMEKSKSLLLYSGTVPASSVGEKIYFIIEYNDLFLNHINSYILSNSPGYFQVNYYHDVTVVIS